MASEFATNTVNTFIKSTVEILLLLVFFGVFKLISGLFSKNSSNGIESGNQRNESYVDTLDKEMEEAGVDNLHDLWKR